MFKSFFIGLLAGIIVTGLFWGFAGRNDLRQIRSDYEGAAGDLKQVQRNISQLRSDADGFTGDLVAVTAGIKSSSERIRFSNERLNRSDDIVREQLDKMEQLADWHKQALILGRDFGDKLYDLRQLNKEGREEE